MPSLRDLEYRTSYPIIMNVTALFDKAGRFKRSEKTEYSHSNALNFKLLQPFAR